MFRGFAIFLVVWQVLTSDARAQLPPMPDSGEPIARPRLYVVERHLDLGTVIEGDKHTLRWQLENRGDADLVIEKAQGSCGCVVAKLTEEQKVLAPGASLELTAEFDSRGRRGRQSKFVMVHSNDPVDPKLKLEFTADLQFLYIIKPPGIVNLRSVKRGRVADATIDILPGKGRGSVEILELRLPEGAPLTLTHHALGEGEAKGRRIRATIDADAALGRLQTSVTVKLRVDGIQRERVLTIRAAVVGELTWHPLMVDQIRNPFRPGKRLTPVTVRSVDIGAFEILNADAGPMFDVVVEAPRSASKREQYSVQLTLREDAKPGPFGTTLSIRTSSLDQPLLRVPVFGIVAPPIMIEPPMILLRADGTAAGTRRRVKLQAPPRTKLEISQIECSDPAVKVAIDQSASARYHHIRFLDVRLDPSAADRKAGTHEATVTVATNVKGAERIEIPVVIDISK